MITQVSYFIQVLHHLHAPVLLARPAARFMLIFVLVLVLAKFMMLPKRMVLFIALLVCQHPHLQVGFLCMIVCICTYVQLWNHNVVICMHIIIIIAMCVRMNILYSAL